MQQLNGFLGRMTCDTLMLTPRAGHIHFLHEKTGLSYRDSDAFSSGSAPNSDALQMHLRLHNHSWISWPPTATK